GRSEIGQKVRVQVEFVSSNPTGPMLFSHARGAVVGDVVARVLDASGYAVQREYYVNDQGKQIRLFGESIEARLLNQPIPGGGYAGEYIDQIAREAGAPRIADGAQPLARVGMQWVKQRIVGDMERLSVHHAQW